MPMNKLMPNTQGLVLAAALLGLLGLLSIATAAPEAIDAPTEASASPVAISDAYARAVPPGVTNSAIFMRMRNPAEQPIALVAASSPFAETVELHTHLQEAGAMAMRRVERIAIPAGDEAVLEPGGLHLMLIGLKQPLMPGDAVKVELTFDDGRTQELTAAARALTPMRDTPAR